MTLIHEDPFDYWLGDQKLNYLNKNRKITRQGLAFWTHFYRAGERKKRCQTWSKVRTWGKIPAPVRDGKWL